MILIMCLDQQNGLMFNNRRQSFDRYVQKMILERVCGNKFLVANYSKKKFPEAETADFLTEGFDGACFAETEELAQSCLPFADTVIIYRWDKTYPADSYFPAEGLENFTLSEILEFEGYSHENVSEEIYVRG